MSPNKCLGITVLPPEAFYPIPWRQWKEYFTEGTSVTDSVLKKLGHSYIAHVWGKHSSNAKFQETTNVYSVLAQKHCPVTYNRVD
jgi:lactosylceramide 4-alpha-galactosyltransferase